jgi:isoamylase
LKNMYQVEPGAIHPLGAVPDAHGVNFALFSEHATSVELLLFAEHNDSAPVLVVPLDPLHNHTFFFWHVYVRGARPGMHYAYRLDGPQDIHQTGNRFNKNKIIIDPYTWGITTALWDRAAAIGPQDNLHSSMRAAIIDTAGYDWEGDQPLKRPLHETIIYEVHAGGLTRSPSSASRHPGTFAGIIEKIPYLQALGVTAVELLPIFAFDEQGVSGNNPVTGQPLKDYWGYNPVCHFAPHAGYCVSPGEGSHILDFRNMVKALHKAGIEVILDVVFNHTGEGNHLGPTISFKGLDNSIYYYLVADDKQYYFDYTGTGNTFNCNHPITDKLISECLKFWVEEMHVDGFRFDEATILSRGPDGQPMAYPPVLWHISLDEELADTKVIAEAWDASGLYEVGNFPGERWSEWNGRYRDDIRRFVRGDTGLVSAVATRIAGSADLYDTNGRAPTSSINFITCHDGFTLNDLVSYNNKHNEGNGQNNQDGIDNNLSWNCGVEGPTNDASINALRQRQIKNFAAILLLSQGVPMLLGGDEFARTQQGNNNAYCQDNEISWFDWTLLEKNQQLFRFFKNMIAFRKRHPNLQRQHFFTGLPDQQGQKDIDWHGCKLFSPGWNDPNSAVLAFTIWGQDKDDDIHVMLNMEWEDLNFDVPPLTTGRQWHKVVDTAAESPQDIMEPGHETVFSGSSCNVIKHSVVVLVARKP